MNVSGAPSRALRAGLLLCAWSASPVFSQEAPSCCASFDYVLERTIFKVDAVRLELVVRGDTPDRVAALARGHLDPGLAGDSVAALYLAADGADVRMTFLRSFSLGRFLDENRNVLEKLSGDGILTSEEFQALDVENVARFAVLAADGIRDGDRLEHQIRGDTVTTRYTDVAGTVRIDEVRVGSGHRRALLGSLFGPRSGFRKGLLDLVFDRAQAEISTP